MEVEEIQKSNPLVLEILFRKMNNTTGVIIVPAKTCREFNLQVGKRYKLILEPIREVVESVS